MSDFSAGSTKVNTNEINTFFFFIFSTIILNVEVQGQALDVFMRTIIVFMGF